MWNRLLKYSLKPDHSSVTSDGFFHCSSIGFDICSKKKNTEVDWDNEVVGKYWLVLWVYLSLALKKEAGEEKQKKLHQIFYSLHFLELESNLWMGDQPGSQPKYQPVVFRPIMGKDIGFMSFFIWPSMPVHAVRESTRKQRLSINWLIWL